MKENLYCHDHPDTRMVKFKKKLVACPVCGRVRVKNMRKLQKKQEMKRK